MNKKF